jgi:hypothetical protein
MEQLRDEASPEERLRRVSEAAKTPNKKRRPRIT